MPHSPGLAPDVIRVLTDNHRRFLTFLERRVGSREAAEDILQDAFVRTLPRRERFDDERSILAWFYRILRNAVVDRYRKQGLEQRLFAAEEDGRQVPDPASEDPELFEEVCRCVRELVDTLKPEYAEAIRHVDLEGGSVTALAAAAAITPNNAAVRLHRAHQALRRQVARICGTCATHACMDCRCNTAAARSSTGTDRGMGPGETPGVHQ
jgi:RNA polymerase sigma-70 factor (ECF subfamily)